MAETSRGVLSVYFDKQKFAVHKLRLSRISELGTLAINEDRTDAVPTTKISKELCRQTNKKNLYFAFQVLSADYKSM